MKKESLFLHLSIVCMLMTCMTVDDGGMPKGAGNSPLVGIAFLAATVLFGALSRHYGKEN